MVELPPYLPYHPTIIEEFANHLDAIQVTDDKVGLIMDKLSENGLLKNTIIFFFSDHGMRLTRHKQFLYVGGIHVPLIIVDFRGFNEIETGYINEDLISGIYLGPSSLALAGIPTPEHMEGINIFSESIRQRKYVISTRDRCDFTLTEFVRFDPKTTSISGISKRIGHIPNQPIWMLMGLNLLKS